MINDNKKINFVFFGSSRFSVIVLDELEKLGYVPSLIVTTPDKPKGRGLILQPTPVKEWGLKRKISVLDPIKLDSEFIAKLQIVNCKFFLVASYGKIIPSVVFNIPQYKTLNIHPSLLPKYRGASPLQSAMLNDDKRAGVTIMRINEKMDEGPIIAQKEVAVSEWPTYEEFEELIAKAGARLLAEIIPDWIGGRIKEQSQDNGMATYTKKIVKEDALLDLNADARINFLKVQAFHEWPTAYFMAEGRGLRVEGRTKKIRVKVTKASFKDGQFVIEKVIPEGSKEMGYEDFVRGYFDPKSPRFHQLADRESPPL